MAGDLFVVATPIGNMDDITLRALRILKAVDVIAAEDTRQTLKLLSFYKFRNRLVSYNDMNKFSRTKELILHLKNGKNVAIVSDSGTPGISDPGFFLVRECVKEGIKVIPVPGATAFASALVCSGLPTDKFTFYGFLSKKDAKKEEFFTSLKDKKETAVFYESPYRIQETLDLMNKLIPEKHIVIAREITKKFEEFIRGRVAEVHERCKEKQWRGEFVVVVY